MEVFYRQALTILRPYFETAILGVFYSRKEYYKQPTARYKQWRNGKRDSPADIRKIARSLAKRSDMSIKVDEETIFQKLKPVYDSLSEHVHGQGIDVYKFQEGRENFPRYLEKSFDLWYKKLTDVFDVLCFLCRIFFLNQLKCYLNSNQGDKESANRLLQTHLVKLIPEFRELIQKALN